MSVRAALKGKYVTVWTTAGFFSGKMVAATNTMITLRLNHQDTHIWVNQVVALREIEDASSE